MGLPRFRAVTAQVAARPRARGGPLPAVPWWYRRFSSSPRARRDPRLDLLPTSSNKSALAPEEEQNYGAAFPEMPLARPRARGAPA
jgi:hypothetical protein